MTLVWVEPFDQYGANNAIYLGGSFGYTDTALSSWPAGRTGTYALGLFNAGVLRRALDTSVVNCGQGAALNPQVGINNDVWTGQGMRFESAGKTPELLCTVLSDNSIGVFDRTSALKGKTAANTIILSTYQWIEIKAIGNTAGVNTGSCEVRINGIQKVVVNGINLPNSFAFVAIGGSTSGQVWFDDWIVWDTNGTKNNDFMGDRRLVLSLTNANLALQDFTPSAGNAWDCLNDTPPVDAGPYVNGAAAGNISEFTKTGIGIASNDIAAAVVIGRMFKTDAGVASGRVGINSSANVVNSAEFFPGTTGAWFRLIQELNPNGNIAWLQAAYDAAAIRITRVQ